MDDLGVVLSERSGELFNVEVDDIVGLSGVGSQVSGTSSVYMTDDISARPGYT